MKFSESWLREWVNPSISTSELTHQMTMAGIEVRNISSVGKKFTRVKVGQIIECVQHPNADRLYLTKVDVDGKEDLDIICGASNCRQGIKVAVATIGAVLPDNVKIKKAKLRGQFSYGMLCSFIELGIDDYVGEDIIELPEHAPIGSDFYEFFNLNDVSIDLDLTANRADCFSIRGLAREVAALNCTDIVKPDFQAAKIDINHLFSVEVRVPEACPHYLCRVVKGLNIGATVPLWMKEKLRRSGINSINPVVDVTNYVLLEQGQPVYALDSAKIEGKIIVRMARQGEKLILLDGKERILNSDTLVTSDANKVLSIAGIFGGESANVNLETKDVLLECAFFTPEFICGRARSYGLQTNSSVRFERGVDYELQMTAMERATQLLVDICGGEVAPVVSVKAAISLPKRVMLELRRSKLNALLGHHISDSDVTKILQGLDFFIEKRESNWLVKTPTWRFDIAIEEDLIEEIARIYGYDNIPNKYPVVSLKRNEPRRKNQSLRRVRDLLVDLGYCEAITYSFVEPKQQRLIVPQIKPLKLPYPISVDMSVMRLGLIQGLLNSAVYNQKRQQKRIYLFEYGLCFAPCISSENGIRQEPMLAAIIVGTLTEDHWAVESKKVDFFDLKGHLESILNLSMNEKSYDFRKEEHPALHPNQSASILVDGEKVGIIGIINPKLECYFEFNSPPVIFEIKCSALDKRTVSNSVTISKFPFNRRDISVLVDEEVACSDVINACLEVGGELLKDAKLFDVYVDNSLEVGKKSLAIALILQSSSHTLKESDINLVVKKIVLYISEKFRASLRG
ncbi:integration host factor subunit alpha [Candidatus Photodesmus blepharus]|uniref:Phenylalanine--tRNA ligase beta subunit n=1 Tax=Candidatus Photodesmus blepharonis TaxID=1179155 RepID=A0A084CMB8_9GAMM|nr:phenylalanine--tRNA ligase subunit beta [Candidatus Photodesmus blepharus]KEY90947.1 integration host factor subunit alpha [Candidatus Photodesmus blepharus]